MKPIHRNRRLGLISLGALLLAGAATLIGVALNSYASYFKTPSEAIAMGLESQTRVRLGGMVENGSIETGDGPNDAPATYFRVTDGASSLRVYYAGILPDLFREGQGVIAEGRFDADGLFIADNILAKHDENYVPRELKDVMERAKADEEPND